MCLACMFKRYISCDFEFVAFDEETLSRLGRLWLERGDEPFAGVHSLTSKDSFAFVKVFGIRSMQSRSRANTGVLSNVDLST